MLMNLNKGENMYIVTKDGKRLPVDDSVINGENKSKSFLNDVVAVYDENVDLVPIWILQLQKDSNYCISTNIDLEIIKEIRYHHKPTKEEVLWVMSAYGIRNGGLVTIVEGYELNCID